jgi:photosystem II PsbY protein
MDFDFRLLIVLLPLLLAGGWAVRNIYPFAVKQVQAFLDKSGVLK